MAKRIRRTIRKVPQPLAGSFDDQLWPVNLMLLVLGSFITGELMVVGTWSTDPIWQNGWMLVAAIWGVWISILGVMLAAWRMGGVMARRTQLSLTVALFIVLALLTSLAFVPVFTAIVIEEDGPHDVVKNEEVVIPDYVQVEQLDQDQQQFQHERPVVTETPDTPATEVEKQKVEEKKEIEQERPQTEPVPEIAKQAERPPRERPVQRRTPPRHSETTSQLSRQAAPAQPAPNKVATPTVADTSQSEPTTQLEAQTASVVPRKSESSTQRPSPSQQQESESNQPQIRTARRPTPRSETPQLASARPTPQRTVRQATAVPNTRQVARPTPASTPQTQASKLAPRRAAWQRRAESPVVQEQNPDAQLADASPRPTQQSTRANPSPRHATLAQNRRPSPTRAPQLVKTPTSSQPVADQVATSEQAPAASPLQASTAGVSRRASENPTPVANQATDSDVAASVPTQSLAATRPRHAPQSRQPSVRPHNDTSRATLRTSNIAQAAASPAAVSSPDSVQSSELNPSARQPRVAALSRSRRGMAGAGQQMNLDRGQPARRTVSDVASASARRQRATSEAPDASALATSRQARTAKDRAMADAPSATLQARDVDVATAAGVQNPSDIDATSSAAQRNRSAAQTQGNMTADAGSTDFDTGPTQIASEFSTGRASGGGEADLHQATQTPRASRVASPGGADLAALVTDAVASEPTDIRADGGGRPPAPSADAVATAAQRVRAEGPTSAAVPSGAEATDAQRQRQTGGATELAAARPRQSTATDALPGATAGGGTQQPARESGVTFTASTQADLPQLPQRAGGRQQPRALQAPAPALARQDGAAGMEGTPTSQPTGADAGELALNVPLTGATGSRAGVTARDEFSGQPAATVADSTGGAPLRIAQAANLPGVTQVTVDETELAGGGAEADPDQRTTLGAGQGSPRRQPSGGSQVLVKAETGDGGIGSEVAPQAGNPSRKAQRHSDVITVSTDARFQQRDVGGPKHAGDTRARDTQSAFQGRKKRPGTEGGTGSPPRQLEAAIKSGLEFLKNHQMADGSWSLNDDAGGPGSENESATIQSDTAATGLALMCFLGAGYDHFDYGGKYTSQVQQALDYLVARQHENGDFYQERDPESSQTAMLYSHAIATMAVCEAYGMTRDPKLKNSAQNAIHYIEQTQHPQRGGWRYQPGTSSDLSVTGWMVAALKSGELAGLKVQPSTYANAFKYLDTCQAGGSGGSMYVYNPHAPGTAQQRHGRRASESMTAVGLLLRLYQGWDRTRHEIRNGASQLGASLPQHAPGQRDTYYWYYATQVMFHMRGDVWQRWEQRLQEVLWSTQESSGPYAGSWNPRGRVPDRWGAHGGRIYVTAMNLLSLEVSYRYLPLYQETDR